MLKQSFKNEIGIFKENFNKRSKSYSSLFTIPANLANLKIAI